MIALARRYGTASLALLGIALLAVALHHATAARFDPCADPAQLTQLEAFGPLHSVRKDVDVGSGRPPLWVEGRLPPRGRAGRPVLFRFIRIDAPHAFYHKFEPFLIDPVLPEDRSELRPLRVGSDVLPVHRSYDDSSDLIRITRYFFVQGTQPVSHPFPGGLAIAWDQLVRGTQPVGLFVVTGVAKPATVRAFEARTEAWLAEVWTDYRELCRPDSSG